MHKGADLAHTEKMSATGSASVAEVEVEVGAEAEAEAEADNSLLLFIKRLTGSKP